MKFIFKVILTAAVCYVVELFLPWWTVALVSFGVNLVLPTKGFNAFLSGFLGVGLLWLGVAWLIDSQSGGLLTERVAGIFEFTNPVWMIALSGGIGGLVGGLAGLCGTLFRNLRRSEEVKGSYYA
ncbi:MAG: hypothetical protein WA960_20970 [Tunicatimonas sp.]